MASYFGVMKRDVHQLGTSLRLQAGQRIIAWDATNLPQGGYFARPADLQWSDGIERGNDDSIHVTADDVELEDSEAQRLLCVKAAQKIDYERRLRLAVECWD